MNARRWIALCLAAVACSCGRPSAPPPDDEAQRDRQLERLMAAIHTIQDRYVDVERTEQDALVAGGLRGMLAAIDPHAVLVHTNAWPAPEPIPADITLAEINTHEEAGLVVVRIFAFTPDLVKHLRTLEDAASGLSPRGILLDCRGAFGDDVASALAAAEWFLPRGTVVGYMQERQDAARRELATRRAPVWPETPMVALTDRETAGPGELLAAALRHHRRATLVGEPTRGFAMIQTPIVLTPDWMVLLSTGRAMDPSGRDITGNPLAPDIALDRAATTRENVDTILHLGLATLRGHLAP